METIITIHKSDKYFNEQYFFSTDHCQPNLSNEWVPVTRYNTTKKKIKDNEKNYPIIGATSIEIPNPDPKYQA